jgi:hypothetical protein
MSSQSFTVVRVDFRARGILQIALGLILGVLGAFYIGVPVAVLNIVVGAALFGGLSYPRTNRTVRRAFAIARPGTDVSVEPFRETQMGPSTKP